MNGKIRVWRSWRKASYRFFTLTCVGVFLGVFTDTQNWPSAGDLAVSVAGCVLGLAYATAYYLRTSVRADNAGIVVRGLFRHPRSVHWHEIDRFEATPAATGGGYREGWEWTVDCSAVLASGETVRLPLLDRSKNFSSRAKAVREGPPDVAAIHELGRLLEEAKGPTWSTTGWFEAPEKSVMDASTVPATPWQRAMPGPTGRHGWLQKLLRSG